MFDRQALIEVLGELIERISADGGPVRISDERDIATLLSMLGVESLDAAEELFEYFYRGEALHDRAILMVASILRSGLPAAPAPLPPITW